MTTRRIILAVSLAFVALLIFVTFADAAFFRVYVDVGSAFPMFMSTPDR